MNMVCLDLEGVLVPEIWIAFSEESGIPELRRTTRDEPDYDKLMRWRLGILKEHGLKLSDAQNVIAKPLMKKLGWPTILCNNLVISEDGFISDFKMRCRDTKLTTVRAFQSIGYDTIASGDSYNDLDMILAGKAGFLFRSTEKIKNDYPQLPAFETYDELLSAIRAAL